MKGFIEVTAFSGEKGFDYFEEIKCINIKYIVDIDIYDNGVYIFYHDYSNVYRVPVKESYEEIKHLIEEAQSNNNEDDDIVSPW